MTPTTNEAANTRTNNFSDSFAKKNKIYFNNFSLRLHKSEKFLFLNFQAKNSRNEAMLTKFNLSEVKLC